MYYITICLHKKGIRDKRNPPNCVLVGGLFAFQIRVRLPFISIYLIFIRPDQHLLPPSVRLDLQSNYLNLPPFPANGLNIPPSLPPFPLRPLTIGVCAQKAQM